MKRTKGLSFAFLALLFTCVYPVAGEEKNCSASQPSVSCTLGEIQQAAYQETLKSRADPVVEKARETTIKETRDLNMAVSTPDSFASDLHASVQNFLNLFDLAISDVEESEDGRALIVRLNPLRRGRNQLGLTLTVTKPTIGGTIEGAIPEGVRTATVEKLEGLQEDLDDLTFSLSYTRNSKLCQLDQIQDGRCWGRRVETYRTLLSHALKEAVIRRVDQPDPFEMQFDLNSRIEDAGIQLAATDNLLDLTVLQIAEDKRGEVVALVRQLGTQYGEAADAAKMYYSEAGFGYLASLVDNQPQLTATASYRDPADFGGPDEASFDLELQWGRKNLNWLFNQEDHLGALAELDKDEIAKDKFVLTVSYKWRDEFQLDELLIPGDDGTTAPLEGFEAIDDDSLEEFQAKLQWGQPFGREIIGDRQARFDLSAEGIWTSDDEKRNENRWIATLTLTVPLGDAMSLPISLKYADKPEFLKDTREDLGVHFGISYRLPWEPE